MAFYHDGHAPACGTDGQVCKSYTTRKAVRQRNQQAREQGSSSSGSGSSASGSPTGVSPAYDLFDGWVAYHYAVLRFAARDYLRHSPAAADWASRKAAGFRIAGRLTVATAGYISAVEQWFEDDEEDFTVGQKLFRSGASALGTIGGSVGGAALGFKACTPLGAIVCSPTLALAGAEAGQGFADSSLKVLDESSFGTPDVLSGPVTSSPIVSVLRGFLK